MKIAFANKQLPSGTPNGVSVQVHILANELQKMGHSVTCYSFSEKPPDSLYEHVRLLWGTDSRVKRKFVPAMKFRAIRTQDYDIVHYHGDDYLCKGALNRVRTFYGSAVREAVSAKKVNRFLYQALFYAFELISSRKKGTLVGISKDTLKCIPSVKHEIPCGVPLELFREGGQKSPTPSILFVGDLESRKRGNLLLSIFKNEVLSEYPECILTIVGSQFCSAPNVRYLGNIPVESLVEEYQKSW
ncbi:MAG: glycosyltransferase family 4 protein, partial [Fibrobacter sp.]|nr:glycosyltransferase family 4 protein [Fibrobacter sp.]